MTEPGGQATVGGRSMLDNMIGVSDMVLLEPLTEDSLIENLWDRYNNKDIYVSFESLFSLEPLTKSKVNNTELVLVYTCTSACNTFIHVHV